MPAKPPLLQLHRATLIKGHTLEGGKGQRVLDSLSLTVREGEHTAILGPNGSGKTSLIRLVSRQDWPLARHTGPPPVRIFGEAVWDVFQLRQRMGLVSPQMDQGFIQAGVLGLEAVVSGFFAAQGLHFHHAVTPEMEARARAALDSVGEAHLAGRALDAMSTGEVRRILIARCLVHDPPALLLDEPTAGLDMLARRRFLDLLRELARAGKTIVLVTHHAEEIIPEIGRVILLDSGRIAADGSKHEVLTGERLTSLFGAPVEVRAAGDWYRAELV
jgi:iron complex transport system ATP-binding protein